MKKLLFSVLFTFFMAWSAQSQIVITEIMYNPPESGTDSLEFFELYNNSGAAVDLSGWNFTQGITFTFNTGESIASHQYITLAKSNSAFLSVFGFAPTYEWGAAGGALTNSPGEDIELRDANGNVIDYVDYKNSAPWPTGANGNGPSLVLCDVNADNNDPASWIDCTTATGVVVNGHEIFANPNAPSGCPSGITAYDDNFTVASGETSNLDVTVNDYIIDPAAALVTIVTAPLHGTATVNSDNTIAYTPAAGYCGPDVLTYKVCDQSGCDNGTVNLTVKCYPQYTIAQISGINANGVADSINVTCELQAVTYGVNLRASGLQFTIIDDTNNGIVPFRATGNAGYTVNEGDKIKVRGTINQFNGLLQITVDTVIMVSANNPLVTPLLVINHSEATESKLIRINNLHLLDPTQWATGVGTGFSAYAISDDHPLDTVQIRIDNDVELFNAPAPTQNFNLVGIGGQFDSSSPYTSGYQIQPRYNADLEIITGTKAADFSNQVQVSPNPVQDILNIRSSTNFEQVAIFNAQGGLMQTLHNLQGNQSINTGNWPSGLYFIRFEKDGKTWSTRVVRN